MKVGFIGLGGMGMASNLAKAGYLTAVYNRTTEKAESQIDNLLSVALPFLSHHATRSRAIKWECSIKESCKFRQEA
jgi:prephenate dehydrogenase